MILISLAPSTRAAASNSLGIDVMKDRSKMVANGENSPQ